MVSKILDLINYAIDNNKEIVTSDDNYICLTNDNEDSIRIYFNKDKLTVSHNMVTWKDYPLNATEYALLLLRYEKAKECTLKCLEDSILNFYNQPHVKTIEDI